MPNWCYNNLTIKGKTSELDELLKRSISNTDGEDVFKFSGIHPMTEGEDWYKWNITNWGTKWDIDLKTDEIEIYLNENGMTEGISMDFQTAYNPPTIWLKEVQRIYQNLRFELSYEESGMMFGGIAQSITPPLGDTVIIDNSFDLIISDEDGNKLDFCEDTDEYIDPVTKEIVYEYLFTWDLTKVNYNPFIEMFKED